MRYARSTSKPLTNRLDDPAFVFWTFNEAVVYWMKFRAEFVHYKDKEGEWDYNVLLLIKHKPNYWDEHLVAEWFNSLWEVDDYIKKLENFIIAVG